MYITNSINFFSNYCTCLDILFCSVIQLSRMISRFTAKLVRFFISIWVEEQHVVQGCSWLFMVSFLPGTCCLFWVGQLLLYLFLVWQLLWRLLEFHMVCIVVLQLMILSFWVWVWEVHSYMTLWGGGHNGVSVNGIPGTRYILICLVLGYMYMNNLSYPTLFFNYYYTCNRSNNNY